MLPSRFKISCVLFALATECDAWLVSAEAAAPPPAVAQCNPVGVPGLGPNSHFFTASPFECKFIDLNYPG